MAHLRPSSADLQVSRDSDRSLRILHVAEAFGGGLLEVVRLMAEHAAGAGHAVAIAYGIRPETPTDVRAVIETRVELYPLGWRARSLRAQASAGLALRRLVDQWQPDIVHLHSSFAGVLGATLLSRRTITVFTPHSFASAMANRSALGRALYRLAERCVVRSVSTVGAVSTSEADLARRRGASPQRVVVIENGIPELDDGVLAAGPPRPSGTTRVVASGRIVAQRRPRSVARILAALKDDAEVAWIGGGGEQGEWAAQARRELADAGAPPTGWLPRSEALSRLSEATVYLHWTSWDGQPLSILEAMAVDTIVVASDIAPNREILGSEAVCASEEDAVLSIRRLLSDPSRAARLLAQQRARRGRYSASRMATQWLELYARLAKAPGAAG